MPVEPTIFIVDPDGETRKALFLFLRTQHLPVEPFASAQEFLERYTADQAGCLILEDRLPGMSGRELQRQLATRNQVLPLIFLTAHGEVSTAVQALRNGAVDFLEKPYNEDALLAAVHVALARDAHLRRERAQRQELLACLDQLTAGEREVLVQMLAGHSYKAIARKLGISYKTVEARRGKLMRKMGCETTVELLRRFLIDRIDISGYNASHDPGEEG
jgi:FixJ family two-component response regulator